MKTFWCSFGLSLCTIILVAGMITVDYRGRKMSFGDDEPPISISRTSEDDGTLKIRLFGVNKGIEIPNFYKIWDFICDFSCIPHE